MTPLEEAEQRTKNWAMGLAWEYSEFDKILIKEAKERLRIAQITKIPKKVFLKCHKCGKRELRTFKFKKITCYNCFTNQIRRNNKERYKLLKKTKKRSRGLPVINEYAILKSVS